MSDRFDEYLKQEMNSISQSPIPSSLWDSEKAWGHITAGLKPQPKTVSINWLYAAAAVLLLLLSISSGYTIYYSSRARLMAKENSRLLNQITAQNISLGQSHNQPERVVTVFQTKEKIKREIVLNTVYVHDTIKVVSYIKSSDNTLVGMTDTKAGVDTPSVVMERGASKTSKLHFVIATEPSPLAEGDKYMFVSANNLIPKGERVTSPSGFAIKISNN